MTVECGSPSQYPQNTRELKSLMHYFWSLFSFDRDTAQGLYVAWGLSITSPGPGKRVSHPDNRCLSPSLIPPRFFPCKVAVGQSQAEPPGSLPRPLLLLMQPKPDMVISDSATALHPVSAGECGTQIPTLRRGGDTAVCAHTAGLGDPSGGPSISSW